MTNASNDLVDRLLKTERVMRLPSGKALSRFTMTNPQFQGAGWADCLDILLDSDAHLSLTEPLYDELADVGTEKLLYVSMVAVTLLWANADIAPEGEQYNVTADEVRVWLDALVPS